MSTILAYTSPARGHLFPMMDVLLVLKNRGHRVVVQTLETERNHVLDAGLEHRSIAPAIEALELNDHEGANPIKALRLTFDTWLARAPHELEDLEHTVADLEPDFLLVDANTHGASAFAEDSEIPWALHMPYCLPTPSRDAPAFGPGFPPPRSVLGRMRDGFMRWVFNRATAGNLRKLNALRQSRGLPALSSVTELYDLPELILYRTAEPFEYARSDWSSAVECLGPGLWAPPADSSGELQGWLREMPEPRILVSISTEAQKDGAIVETAIAALKDESGSVICTTSAEDPGQFDQDATNVHVRKFLPHAEVLPHVSCVVTHGGMGTVQRTLAAGVPLCVVPWGRDQMESAQRVVEADAGTRVNPTRLTADRLRDAVQEAMTKQTGAARVARGFREAGGASCGADLIESRLESTAEEKQVA